MWSIKLKHYKVKRFTHEARKASVPDTLLSGTLKDFLTMDEKGQQKCSLGAGLYKLRIASNMGQGKSSGARSVLAFRKGIRVMWLHLFSKNEKGNVTKGELKKLKRLSDILLNLVDHEISELVKLGELQEVQEDV